MRRQGINIMLSILIKSGFLFVVLLLFTGVPPGLAAPVRIAEDIALDGKVLAIDAPRMGMLFSIIWESQNGRGYRITEFSRERDSLYDMRKYPPWQGKAALVAIDELGTVRASVRKPNFADELKIFLAPELWTPRTVNFFYGHSLFTLKWDRIVLFVFLLSTAAFFLFKRRFFLSLILCFIIAWSLISVRAAWDDAGFLRYAGNTEPVMITGKMKEWFAGVAADQIKDGRWSAEELSGYNRVIAYYELAEMPFSPGNEGQDQSWRIVNHKGRLILEAPE